MAVFKSSFVLLSLFASAMAVPMFQGGNNPFTQQNGADAIAQNNQFSTLTQDSPCTNGQVACVAGKFAQCVNSKFVLTSCVAGETCAALPLVNKAGTSVTCTTEADKNARIAATGATGPSPARRALDLATLQRNAFDAQIRNTRFRQLITSSQCVDGEQACISGALALCTNNRPVLTPCLDSTVCLALPNMDSRGTTISCISLTAAEMLFEQAGVGATVTGGP